MLFLAIIFYAILLLPLSLKCMAEEQIYADDIIVGDQIKKASSLVFVVGFR
jgi:hypothetical protein